MTEWLERFISRANYTCALRNKHAETKRARDEALADRNFPAAEQQEKRMATLLQQISHAREETIKEVQGWT